MVVWLIFIPGLCGQDGIVQFHTIKEFNNMAVWDFPLSTREEVSHYRYCTSMCAEDVKCKSCRYNALNKICSTYGVGYSEVGNTYSGVTMETGSKLFLRMTSEYVM